ncbi:DNA cytosine methyltransferase [Stenotrophomonas terrae]|uniref:DNA cytosine methyltransferase n=1 Tax=Stenotrophomonas terrae TaxID=405446 RepID=UPI003208F7C7
MPQLFGSRLCGLCRGMAYEDHRSILGRRWTHRGAEQAGCNVVWAANHWPAAAKTDVANHPGTLHVCQDLQQADRTPLPDFDVLLASPACQGHTPARGKERPHHDATRSTAWAVVSALEAKSPDAAVIENVPAFMKWKLFPAWCAAVHALGYAISPHLLDAADFGVPQHRVRIFIVLTKSKHPLELKLPKRPHLPAASFIDFEAGTWSPVERPGRAAATLARVRAGRAAFGARFVAPYFGNGSGLTGRSLDRPIGTITTRDRWAIIDGDRMRMLSLPESAIAMGFPRHYKLPANKKDGMQMMGNAVCPPKACAVITALRMAA